MENRLRAGLLEQNTVDLLNELGVARNLKKNGIPHHGVMLSFNSERVHIPFEELTGGPRITIYGQRFVVRDLIENLVDENGKTIIEPNYLNATNFKDGFAIVVLTSKDIIGYNEILKKNKISTNIEGFVIGPSGELLKYLEDPIESVLAVCSDGSLAIEAKSPIDLDNDLGLPRGNIFHRDLDFPFIDGTEQSALKWGSETDDAHIFLAGAGARRGGGVSGIAGHNAAMAALAKD